MIRPMSTLRRHRLAAWVLAWFALWITATMAAPMVAGSGLQLVCSGNSFKLVTGDDAAPAQVSGHFAHCPACVHPAAPPPALLAWQVSPALAALVVADAGQAPVSRSPAAPPPARGPPSFS
jgi:hypothetical protein